MRYRRNGQPKSPTENTYRFRRTFAYDAECYEPVYSVAVLGLGVPVYVVRNVA